MQEKIILGGLLSLEDYIRVVRYGAMVEFSQEYIQRVNDSRALVEKWIREGKAMYGVTTGLGILYKKRIEPEQIAQLQKNILHSHAVSVGQPLSEEVVRGMMVMVLQSLGEGHSGVRMEPLEMYREFLNRGIVPWAPGSGSVGYLAPEAHMALVLIGEGKAWYCGELLPAKEALSRAGLKPLTLAAKEALSLVSGTTSVTAMGALAIYDMIQAAKASDIISALTLENLKGVTYAFDPRVMSVRPHSAQAGTARNVLRILEGSRVMEEYRDSHLQDALSLRCIPQLHGAAKKTLYDAAEVIEVEMNSCCDNPVVWNAPGEERMYSACNADSSYVGIEMDSACIAAVNLAKMSDRHNARLIDDGISGYPAFLVRNPGLNTGLMIPQYTQAGLIADMRVLAHPATVDNTPTCGVQEDYVAMGYTAAQKALAVSEKLEYVLAIELLSDYEAQSFNESEVPVGPVSGKIYRRIAKEFPLMEQDEYLYQRIETLRQLIHSGELNRIVEEEIGALE